MPPRKINAEKEVLGYRRGKKKKKNYWEKQSLTQSLPK